MIRSLIIWSDSAPSAFDSLMIGSGSNHLNRWLFNDGIRFNPLRIWIFNYMNRLRPSAFDFLVIDSDSASLSF